MKNLLSTGKHEIKMRWQQCLGSSILGAFNGQAKKSKSVFPA
jgi:hypothetical protein